jgi:Na+/H+ antiporter NhaD/arsenite permease-like protein
MGEGAALLVRSDAPATYTDLLAILVFAGTYAVIAIGKLPGFQLDRAGAALLGASLMVGAGVLPLEEAYRAVDFDTITLLLGMMIVVANLRVSGFFRLVSDFVVARAKHPFILLTSIVVVSGLLSAFLVNDAICLVMTPLALDLLRRLRRNCVPYLMAIPMASNVGSVATITGNPQNMMIGSFSHIPYGVFAGALWPVALVGLLLTIMFIALVYPQEFFSREPLPEITPRQTRYHGALILKAVAVTVVMMLFFFAGQPVAKVAIVGGAFLLLTRKVKSDKIYREIDWPLLLMFVGLFVVVAGLEKAVVTPDLVAAVGRLDLGAPAVLSLVTAALSNVVSNVPAVLVLKPFIAGVQDPQRDWLVVAMAATLAGNFTLVGSVANLIVAQKAKAAGVDLGFWPYFSIGAPLTVVTILFGIWWL